MVGRAKAVLHGAIGRGPVSGILSGTAVTVMVQSSSTTTSLMIPLAGMYFANTMNAISLAAERIHASMHEHKNPIQARNSAFKSAMIPQVNSLLAVGLVTLPGMMTGQILSDISQLIAVRYQIMIMTMLFGASSLGTALMLSQLGRKFTQHSKQADTH